MKRKWNHVEDTWLGYQCTVCFKCFPFIESAEEHDKEPCVLAPASEAEGAGK